MGRYAALARSTHIIRGEDGNHITRAAPVTVQRCQVRLWVHHVVCGERGHRQVQTRVDVPYGALQVAADAREFGATHSYIRICIYT